MSNNFMRPLYRVTLFGHPIQPLHTVTLYIHCAMSPASGRKSPTPVTKLLMKTAPKKIWQLQRTQNRGPTGLLPKQKSALSLCAATPHGTELYTVTGDTVNTSGHSMRPVRSRRRVRTITPHGHSAHCIRSLIWSLSAATSKDSLCTVTPHTLIQYTEGADEMTVWGNSHSVWPLDGHSRQYSVGSFDLSSQTVALYGYSIRSLHTVRLYGPVPPYKSC